MRDTVRFFVKSTGRFFAVLALVALSSRGIPRISTVAMADVRSPDSISFPRHDSTGDIDEILEKYPDYLRFALAVGRDVDRVNAARLEKTFEALRNRDKTSAARFLRGLRFEMLQKLELLGLPPSAVTTATPVIRRWVAKWMPTWLREADEYNFRARAAAVARK